ncbi:MAG: alpha-amylase [Planctomycetaceae bacterium]|nr:alpha-amylase [Planctomycetaceae bacterium]
MSSTQPAASFENRIQSHLRILYPESDIARLARDIAMLFDQRWQLDRTDLWSERDSLLITYGDSILREGEKPLQTLSHFLDESIQGAITAVHVLPFCPYSSDDGFAVIDYWQVDPELGTWDDLARIAETYRLMSDIVINHVSAKSDWFQNYLQGKSPGEGYFIEVDLTADLSEVVRPRSTPLLRKVETPKGTRHVWCTFSHDQIDLNFQNPAVLLEMFSVLKLCLEQGVRLFRLDAVGYLWKNPGTACIHLPETHEMVRLIRAILDEVAPGSILITETNVPNQENLTYFGNRNEAHIIYNFSLAPLVVHALLTGRSEHLQTWMMSMPPAPPQCTYLNFTASHDGIGMRPAEGLIEEEEQVQMVNIIQRFGGRVSRRSLPDGTDRIYELNVSLFDALRGTISGPDRYQIDRFLCSQTIMMGLEGLPAFYIHSLLATPNDEAGVEQTGRSRTINRHRWEYEGLRKLLADSSTSQAKVSTELLRRIRIRSLQSAFHPSATQFTLHLQPSLFGFWRQSRDRQQSIFAIHNLSPRKQELELRDINLITNERWIDLISGIELSQIHGTIRLGPYQCLWITNRPSAS